MTDVDVVRGPDGSLYVAPTIPEDAPPQVREGLARRRLAVVDGVCPCGGELTMPNRAERRAARRAGRPARGVVEHNPGCPAVGVDARWSA